MYAIPHRQAATIRWGASAAIGDPNDGNYHVWGLFWSLTEQKFYYDGRLVGYRPRVPGHLVHGADWSLDLRITIECGTNVWAQNTGTPAQAAARGEFANANVLVDHIRVHRRNLPLLPAPEGYITRTDIPASLNPAGTTWQTVLASEFDGAAGSPPPAPWHTGLEWASPHPVLGGRLSFRPDGGVYLDSMARLDGNGNLILGLEWDEANACAKMAYLITGQDGATARQTDQYFTGTEEGLWFEVKMKVPETFPDPAALGFWLFDADGPTGTTGKWPEIDIVEHIGVDFYRDRFMANTHGPTTEYCSSIAEEGGYGIGFGGYFKPTVDFPDAADPPPTTDDLATVKAALTLSVTEDFTGTTLNAARWRVLAEPGRGQSSPLAPVVEWPDHRGQMSSTDPTASYIHDPAAVELADSVLRLRWRKTGPVWGAGGITSAASYGAPRGTLFNAPTRGLVEFRFRVPVLEGTGNGAFYAIRRVPRDDAFGVWPASGEIADFEGTQHPQGVAVNPSGLHAYVNLPNNWGSASGINFAGNSSVLASPAISLLDGQWHTMATHQYPSGSAEVFDFYIDNRFFHRMTVPAAYAERVQTPFVWILSAQGPGFWGVGLPPNDTLQTAVFEIDWLRHWVPTTPPTPGSKPTEAPVLQAKGLSLVWQDRLGEIDEPTDSTNWFAPHMGSRNASADFGVTDNRLSFATFDGKRCLREIYRANRPIYLNYRSQRLPNRYREFGACADVFYPANFNATPQDTSRTSNSGKTVFGLLLGHPDFMRPGFRTDYGWAGSICWPEDMWGSEAGTNWTYRNASGNIEYDWYPHIVGAYVNGQHVMRSTANTPSYLQPNEGAYSHPVVGQSVPPKKVIPKGRWFRMELYGRMDTDRTNGLLEMWVDGTLFAAWTGLDLGGWIGNRGLYKGRSQTPAPAGMAFTYSNTPYYSFGIGPLSNDCDPAYRTLGGFRFIGAFIRAMGGGYSLSTAHIPVNECNGYFYNWRFYGKV